MSGHAATSPAAVPAAETPLDPTDFSLILGGPLYQLFRRSHLSSAGLQLLPRRILVIILIAWVPLLVLSAMGDQAFASATSLGFLRDIEVQARFLLTTPLLIVAELVVHQRLRLVVKQFRVRHLIPDDASVKFDAIVASAFKLRNSVLAETLLIALVYGLGVEVIWRQFLALDTATWYASPADGHSVLTMAGKWYAYISLPIFQFLLLRWYYRFFIWGRFLWQVSRLNLAIMPLHPDRMGGLGFLADTPFAFIPLLVAHSVLVAGQIADRIFYAGATLPEFKVEVAVVAVFLIGLSVGPLLVFSPQLAMARRVGNREYGVLAQRYVREFDAKWAPGGSGANETLLGSSDLQSLADLGNSLSVVQRMSPVPVTRAALTQLAAAILGPMLPLALTMMPLADLLKKLASVLF